MPHDLLTLFSAKAIEYPLALLYLVLFVPFWRYVNPRRQMADVPVPRPARSPVAAWTGVADLFAVPEDLLFHPGHAWARVEGDVVTVGLDDFAQKLVGPIARIALPPVGAAVSQGEHAWTLVAGDGKHVDVLSPVDGTVIAVNEQAAVDPRDLARDPYGCGWLLRVRADRLAANARQLLTGSLARRWTEDAVDRLCRVGPDLGPVAVDGGVPVSGMLGAIQPDTWDQQARTFLLS
jgi:glycine cleavage system H protein